MALTGILIRTAFGWVASALAVLSFPDLPMEAPAIWRYFNLNFLIALGLSVVAAWQSVKAGRKAVSRWLYLPLPRKSLSRLKFLLPLPLVLSAALYLSVELPLTGAATVMFFAFREIRDWRKKQKAIEQPRKSRAG
ncbi:hypothetical protein C8P63_11014 [Melghirimyces profundicolus]|uniref:Uncharacterized protein n=1 Tax=Melghirimyces profundicolus TaxID=1242148 RepID=A0A2T6BUY1_9BACL|nr:hypothetical protein [Melghirimyces profundicolus]PTX59873.1 hypothetical protein C8P63_11014 [Melghirimyces profundicolus]